MNRYGTDCVAPFGAWVVFVVVTTGLHPWLQHAVPLGLLPPNGGTASTLLKKISASLRKKRYPRLTSPKRLTLNKKSLRVKNVNLRAPQGEKRQ